ncbi:hypothetical protein CA54_07680 [Symmachiella macrocystis]|uniref:Uncharacterized protein n=1 Tax=Symmachiella macrocystis TaxID=2527985 RepID=A0A5C6BKU0_9PLAN|nr:hypothetical protein [Symmachiella macrocystis]TWU11956.1 hypothetical protein CA54_07680 [Symmachiella macrocystis]
MRASSHGPFRTLMMIFPMLAVAGLAYLGGYHYHTLAASQTAPSAEEDFGGDIVMLGDDNNAAPQLGVDELFPSGPATTDAPQAEAAEYGRNPDITVISEEPAPETERQRRPSPTKNRRPRSYPSAAMKGWQVAEDPESADGDEAPIFAETTATQANDLDAQWDEAFDERPPADAHESRLQAAIDARRNEFAQRSRQRNPADQLISASRTDDLLDGPESTSHTSPQRDVQRASATEPADFDEGFAQFDAPAESSQELPAASPPVYRDPRNLKEATKILRSWGIRKFKLEATADGAEFRFLCGVTDIHNPSIRRLFVASGEEPLAAVRKVLRQIEDWRAQQ